MATKSIIELRFYIDPLNQLLHFKNYKNNLSYTVISASLIIIITLMYIQLLKQKQIIKMIKMQKNTNIAVLLSLFLWKTILAFSKKQSVLWPGCGSLIHKQKRASKCHNRNTITALREPIPPPVIFELYQLKK